MNQEADLSHWWLGAVKELFSGLQEDGTTGVQIAQLIGKSEGHVSQVKTGKTLPSELALAVLGARHDASELEQLIVAWFLARVDREASRDRRESGENQVLLTRLRSLAGEVRSRRSPAVRTIGRTFGDFPDSFYPLTIVTGDKREERGSFISAADIGAYTATPADTRWLLELGLRHDVVKHVDKNFVLLDRERLVERFAETNLLVVGSPAANHLARAVNRTAVFRFNYEVEASHQVDELVQNAKGKKTQELEAYQARDRQRLGNMMRSFFTGGIFDPTFPDEYQAAKYYQAAAYVHYDFGVLTFAGNPFYAELCRQRGHPNDHRFVSIVAAGIHHPATAHALRRLGQTSRAEGVFERHPYGGLIRVTLETNRPFAERVEFADCAWEDESDNVRSAAVDQRAELIANLHTIEQGLGKGQLANLQLADTDARECRELIEQL
jgi:hypothetical protein